MYPYDLLLEYLRKLDEVQLCELLDISSEDLVERFSSRIRERRATLQSEVEMIIPIGDEELDESDFDGDVDDEDDFVSHYDPFPTDDDD